MKYMLKPPPYEVNLGGASYQKPASSLEEWLHRYTIPGMQSLDRPGWYSLILFRITLYTNGDTVGPFHCYKINADEVEQMLNDRLQMDKSRYNVHVRLNGPGAYMFKLESTYKTGDERRGLLNI